MNLAQLSRVVSHALRHEPWLYELELDDEGWVPVDQLLMALREKGGDWEVVDTRSLERMLETATSAGMRFVATVFERSTATPCRVASRSARPSLLRGCSTGRRRRRGPRSRSTGCCRCNGSSYTCPWTARPPRWSADARARARSCCWSTLQLRRLQASLSTEAMKWCGSPTASRRGSSTVLDSQLVCASRPAWCRSNVRSMRAAHGLTESHTLPVRVAGRLTP